MRFHPAAVARRRSPLRAARLAASALVAFAVAACAHGEPAAPTTGVLELTIGGLPAGATGNVTLTSETGAVTYVTSLEQVSRLDPGTYTLTIEPVLVGNARYGIELQAGIITEIDPPAAVTRSSMKRVI